MRRKEETPDAKFWRVVKRRFAAAKLELAALKDILGPTVTEEELEKAAEKLTELGRDLVCLGRVVKNYAETGETYERN